VSSKFVYAWRSLGWRGRLSMLRSYGYIAQHRISNRLLDVRGALTGACLASTWDESAGNYRGGYTHWRCMKKRGHADIAEDLAGREVHRFNNYVWTSGEAPVFMPISNSHQILPFRALVRRYHGVDTMRRTRVRTRTYERSAAVRRAERHGS